MHACNNTLVRACGCRCLRLCTCLIVRVRACTYECMRERKCECVGCRPVIVYTPATCVVASPFCLFMNPTGDLSVIHKPFLGAAWCNNMCSPMCQIMQCCFGAHPALVPAGGQPSFHGLPPWKTPCAFAGSFPCTFPRCPLKLPTPGRRVDAALPRSKTRSTPNK